MRSGLNSPELFCANPDSTGIAARVLGVGCHRRAEHQESLAARLVHSEAWVIMTAPKIPSPVSNCYAVGIVHRDAGSFEAPTGPNEIYVLLHKRDEKMTLSDISWKTCNEE